MEETGTYDYIVVGAGSAGCVLANRLTADPGVSVLLLEAGGSDRHPYIQAPAGFTRTINHPRFNWCFHTEPSPNVNGRAIGFPRGKALGGSSSINGHLYVRGQTADYDTWAQMGNRGWSFAEVEPYFERAEGTSGDPEAAGGHLHISELPDRHPLCEAYLEAARSFGLRTGHDYNGPEQEGVTYYRRTIRNGRRWSAADAYLHPIRNRQNLRIEKNVLVDRINLDGSCATGVSYHRGGKRFTATAGRECILSAGTIGAPHLLQVSGIGPGPLLQQIGVDVRHQLAGVGEGFQDHYAARVACRVKNIRTLNERAHGLRLAGEIARWFLTGKGLLAFSPAHAAGFVKSEDHLDLPDLQLVFTPASYTEGVIGKLQSFPGMTAGFWQMRPESKGHVRARSPDIAEAPVIQPNYLAEERDRAAVLAGIRWCRRFVRSAPFKPYFDTETLPGADVTSDDEVLDYVRQYGATVYHAIGSCRMGPDALAVVDERLRVRGLERLRVIDASVMPTMPSANTNAATLMIAEKAADMLREDARRA
ncbi:MAG: GMC family oxidoreductase N-terminal domain-containing protein [Pseudomonadota bacterium]